MRYEITFGGIRWAPAGQIKMFDIRNHSRVGRRDSEPREGVPIIATGASPWDRNAPKTLNPRPRRGISVNLSELVIDNISQSDSL